ncbi:DNRLRE domain-containing protein [Nonomuraea fastidiosa]|uniref:DNRLRE domain-containing protein n=1 Tax=Nonomuraea fastidiosa TaxID=46173 RepID=UPI00366A93D6
MALPLSMMSVPAMAQGPTPSPTRDSTAELSPPSTPTGEALAQAKKTNRRVEIESLRSESATFYANPDGKTVRMEMYARPIRVKNIDGTGFTPIDTTLVERDGAIKPKAAHGGLVLSAGRDKTLLRTQAADAAAQIGTPLELPKPRLKENTATYPDVYGKGRDLVVIADATGFRQQVTIAERPVGPVSFRVPVDLPDGLSFKKNVSGRPVIVDEDGKVLTEVRPTLLQDAKAADADGPIDAGKIGTATVSLAEDGHSLVFTPDATFLADPAVTYPVTMAAVADDWWETDTSEWHLGGQDTFVNDKDYQDSWNNFTLDRILVGKSNSGTVRWRSYLRFPDVPAVFAGSKVENADLILWNYLSNDCGSRVGSGVTARRITSDWDEATLTWSSQPSVTNEGADNEPGAYSTDCTGSMNYAWDLIHSVDDIVQAWVDGKPNYGIQLAAGSESDLTNWRRYRTDEAGGCTTAPREQCKGRLHPPILTVDFELPEPPLTRTTVYDGMPEFPEDGVTSELLEEYRGDEITDERVPPARVSREQALIEARSMEDVTESDPETMPPPPEGLTDEQIANDLNPDRAPVEIPTEETVQGHWDFDEGMGTVAADSSGQGHNATLGSTAVWTEGKNGTALSNSPAPRMAGTSRAQARAVASLTALRSGKPVEVVSETSATSITMAQPDGKTFKTEIAARPVRTRQGDEWVPIDTTLTEQSGTLRPKTLAADIKLEISTGGMHPFVRMSAKEKQYSLRWPRPLPKPTVRGSVATYADAAGVGADLVVTALPTGFRYEVVLRHRPSKPLELRIGVEDEGLTLSQSEGGHLLMRGKGKEPVARWARPIMTDAGVNRAKRGQVKMALADEERHTSLVIKPDQALLAKPDTAYPVRVAAAVTVPLSADMDVTTNDTEDWPAYPDNQYLLAGTMTGGLKARVHLQFDTTGLQGSTVTDATLAMNTVDSHDCGATLADGIQVARITSTWTPDNLYWDNKPTYTTEDASTNFKGVSGDCAPYPDSLDWNVTGIVQDWAAGAPNHGLVLKSPNEANIDNYRVFTSSEDTDFNLPPKLIITTSGPASAPAIAGLLITPSEVVSGTTVTTSLTPQLSATVSDTVDGELTGQFEIEHDPSATEQGSGQIWAGTSAAVASGGQVTVSVPAGKLATGWKIRWRGRAANTSAGTTSAWSAWQSVTVSAPSQDPEPQIAALQIEPSQLVDGTIVTTSLTPTLLAQVTGNGTLRAEYEVEHDPAATEQGSGQIWAASVDGLLPGSQARVTVPAGKLVDGWKVRWRARAVAEGASSAWSDWQLFTVRTAQPGGEPLARTAGPVIRTDGSFTVAAWLRWADDQGAYKVVEQMGTHKAPFLLGNAPERGLIFAFTSADAVDATTETLFSDVAPPVDEWFHLAGVYEATSRTATLYLNGTEIKSGKINFPAWNAEGALSLGTDMSGALDEVRLYSKALDADEISALAGGPGQGGTESRKRTTGRPVAAANNNFVYDRVGYDECVNAKAYRSAYVAAGKTRPAINPRGYTKNHFSWCTKQIPMLAVEVYNRARKQWETTDLAAAELVTIGRTFQGSREIEFDVYMPRLNDAVMGTAFMGKNFTVGLNVTGDPSSAACKQVVNSQYPAVFSGPAQYWAGRKVTFKVESPASGWVPGPNNRELIATCTTQLTFTAPSVVGIRYNNKTAQQVIRCDSAEYITWYRSGCIFAHLVPSIKLRQKQFPNAYAHISKAFLAPDTTVPETNTTDERIWPPKTRVPLGTPKLFPGFSKTNTIHRLYWDENRIDRNRWRSQRICGYRWHPWWQGRDPVPWDPAVQQCDEFPFASTYEGSWAVWQKTPPDDPCCTYPKRANITVDLIPAQENQAWGANWDTGGLGRFYMVDRILDEDDFFIRLYDSNDKLVNVN